MGGNTSDRPSVAISGQADIDQVFGFAKAAGAHVIYTLRLRDSTQARCRARRSTSWIANLTRWIASWSA
jgi:hypothetical protein